MFFIFFERKNPKFPSFISVLTSGTILFLPFYTAWIRIRPLYADPTQDPGGLKKRRTTSKRDPDLF